MRKIMLFALAVLLVTPLGASDFGFAGISAGYSTRTDAALIGFNGTYSYLPDINSQLSIGFGSHGDFAIGVNKENDIPIFFAVLFGLAVEYRINEYVSLDFLLGPGIVAEADKIDTYVSLGPALDASFTLGFGKNSIAGFTAGATLYPSFSLLSERTDTFSLAVLGYIGVSFRFPITAIVVPVVAEILD